MRTRFFSVPALDPTEAEEELNHFLSQHRVLTMKSSLVRLKDGAFWSICVVYQPKVQAKRSRKSKVDYREILNSEDFEVYAKLRTLRKEVAEEEAVPAYQVFNNAHLATMVTERMRTLEDLISIPGVGPARVEAHGERFLRVLAEIQPVDESEPEGDAAYSDPD